MQKNNFLFLSPHRGVITFHVPLIIPLFKIFFRTRIISCRDINSLTKISNSRHRSNTDASVRKSLRSQHFFLSVELKKEYPPVEATRRRLPALLFDWSVESDGCTHAGSHVRTLLSLIIQLWNEVRARDGY